MIINIIIFFMTLWISSQAPEGKLGSETNTEIASVIETPLKEVTFEEKKESFSNYSIDIYKSAGLEAKGLSFDLFQKGLTGYWNLEGKGLLSKDKKILTIIDFKKASTEERMYVIDLKNKKLLYQDIVSHGKNSGWNFAKKFSNKVSSHMSSSGFYITAETYYGKHGLSLRLDGVDKGMNDNARKRAIVMHGADYSSKSFIKRHGRLGRSYGCPAVPMNIHKQLITDIKEKTLLFIYSDVAKSSVHLNEINAVNNWYRT